MNYDGVDDDDDGDVDEAGGGGGDVTMTLIRTEFNNFNVTILRCDVGEISLDL
jgi:hypothetical protein